MSRSKQALLTKELFDDWLLHPVTEALREVLAAKRQDEKDRWEAGNAIDFAGETHSLLNAAAIGLCQGFKYVQELTLEKLQGDMDDAGESERTTTAG